MNKTELMNLVGQKVAVYKESAITGTLCYADEFSAKHDYRMPNFFYIGNTSFRVNHVRKVEVGE